MKTENLFFFDFIFESQNQNPKNMHFVTSDFDLL